MGTWFTELSWPPIMVLATGAVAGIAMFFGTQRVKYLAAVLPFVLIGPVIYIVEQRIVTERERVEAAIFAVTSAFERHDESETMKHISAQDGLLQLAVAKGLDEVELTGTLSVTDVAVTMRNQDSRAVSHFRANGPISVKGAGHVGHVASRWELTWQKEGGDWRIINVQRLDPISGEPMGLFMKSERAKY
ncbi:MAG: hypothetical protein WD176_10780 [Pirellulales bacterium]